MSDGLGWSVAMTAPNRERYAAEQVDAQRPTHGYQAWVPAEEATGRLLFPRYILIWVERSWRSLLSTRGIAQVLWDTDGRLALLRPGEVERVMGWCRGGLPPRFTAGDRVTVRRGRPVPVSGMHAGTELRFDRLDAPGRAGVFWSMLGRDQRLVVNEADLAPVG